MLLSRRSFLVKGSLAATSVAVASRSLSALTFSSTSRELASSPEDFLQEPLDKDLLRAMALAAIDAAKRAGAQYADVRIVERQNFGTSLSILATLPRLNVGASLSYGVRVLVDGTWGFVHGQLPTSDSITAAAKSAVLQASTNARFGARHIDLSPAPVVTGEWESPVEILPFTVSLRDQTVHMGAINASMLRVRGIDPYHSSTQFNWTRETKVFASSEGSLTTQRLTRSIPNINISVGPPDRNWVFTFPGVVSGTIGYESVTESNLLLDVKRASEEKVRVYNMPIKTMDVGRFPVIASGMATAKLFGETVSPALELDRVLGFEANASGTSFLSPPLEVLKAQAPTFSQALSVTANHKAPDLSAAKWDDEGVSPEEYQLIRDGRVVDYHTTRETAPYLSSYYQERGMPMRSHGCSTSGTGDSLPFTVGGHTNINPVSSHTGSNNISIDTLIKDVKKGVLLYDAKIEPEPGVSTGIMYGVLLQITNGEITGRIEGSALSFRTARLWKESLATVGGTSTLQSAVVERYKGNPWQQVYQNVTAPAALFKDVDVINYSRKVGQV